MHVPRVSVLLPTYQSARFLQEAIESALRQTFTDFELVIVDNCSTDGTKEVVAAYLHDHRVRYYQNDRCLSLSANWNKCLEYARGAYIKYLCSDDIFHPQILEKFVPVLDQHPEVSLVGCYKEEFGERSLLWKAPFRHRQHGAWVVAETIKNYNYLGEASCVMSRREAIQKVGPFRNYTWITDWEMWVRLLSIGDCYIVPERLCFTRSHPQQVTKKVRAGFINFLEEYKLFSAIRNGRYGLALPDKDNMLHAAIREKAWGCTRGIVKLTPRVWDQESRTLLLQFLRIAWKEKLILMGLIYFPLRGLDQLLRLNLEFRKYFPQPKRIVGEKPQQHYSSTVV